MSSSCERAWLAWRCWAPLAIASLEASVRCGAPGDSPHKCVKGAQQESLGLTMIPLALVAWMGVGASSDDEAGQTTLRRKALHVELKGAAVPQEGPVINTAHAALRTWQELGQNVRQPRRTKFVFGCLEALPCTHAPADMDTEPAHVSPEKGCSTRVHCNYKVSRLFRAPPMSFCCVLFLQMWCCEVPVSILCGFLGGSTQP